MAATAARIVNVPYVVGQNEDGAWCASAQLRPGVGAAGEGLTRQAAIADLKAGLGLLIEETGVPEELIITSLAPSEADRPYPRRESTTTTTRTPPEASSLIPSVNVVVTNRADDILMIRRIDNGNWAVPGGAIDLGESVAQAAVRETREEPESNARSPGSLASTPTLGTSSSTPATAKSARSSPSS